MKPSSSERKKKRKKRNEVKRKKNRREQTRIKRIVNRRLTWLKKRSYVDSWNKADNCACPAVRALLRHEVTITNIIDMVGQASAGISNAGH